MDVWRIPKVFQSLRTRDTLVEEVGEILNVEEEKKVIELAVVKAAKEAAEKSTAEKAAEEISDSQIWMLWYYWNKLSDTI